MYWFDLLKIRAGSITFSIFVPPPASSFEVPAVNHIHLRCMNVLYSDIKHCLLREFDFLKAHGFSDFAEEQIAYEVHFTCAHENGIHIDIFFEVISSTAINIMINGAHFQEISDHEAISVYYRQLPALYDDNFTSWLNTSEEKYMKANFDLYLSQGRELNAQFLKSAGRILQDHPPFLTDRGIYENIILQRKPGAAQNRSDFQEISLPGLQQKTSDPEFMKYFDGHWLYIETDKLEMDIYSPEEFIEVVLSADLADTNIEMVRYQFFKKLPS